MTSIFNSFRCHPKMPPVINSMNSNVYLNILARNTVLPWKYAFYHTLSELLNIHKPERCAHPRARLLCSLTDGVFDNDCIHF